MDHPHPGRDATSATRSGTCGIAVMAKASAPGRTKTRLVPPLTFDEAAEFNTAFLQDVAANICAAARSAPMCGYMAYGPPGANRRRSSRASCRPAIGLIECWLPDFGDCLLGADHASCSTAATAAPSCSTPTARRCRPSLLVETASVLARPGDRAVLGPSTDGGYYLLGLKAAHRRLFEDIAWSTEHVAQQTLERAAEIGLDVHMLPTWYDVDDIDSLRDARRRACIEATLVRHRSRSRMPRRMPTGCCDALLDARRSAASAQASGSAALAACAAE